MSGKLKIILSLGLIFVIIVAGGLVYLYSEDLTQKQDTAQVPQPILVSQSREDYDHEVVFSDHGAVWAADFIPNSDLMLVTASSGSLYLGNLATAEIDTISGLPQISTAGQGGLLDVTVASDYDSESNPLIYLTYAVSASGGTTTELARANLDIDQTNLNQLEVLFTAQPARNSGAHFGSRVVDDGQYLYLTIGDRGDKNFTDHVAQDTTNVLGSTLRLNRDGSIPQDNPFVNDSNFAPEIYAYGQRNIQGMTINPQTNQIYQSQHGEQDGDQIHILEAGGNYGWPIVHEGCTYGSGNPIGGSARDSDDYVSPSFWWDCGSGGFPPAGMDFYTGTDFESWNGDLFVGGLASRYLARFEVTSNGLNQVDSMFTENGWRIRDVVMRNQDGHMYLIVESSGSESVVRVI